MSPCGGIVVRWDRARGLTLAGSGCCWWRDACQNRVVFFLKDFWFGLFLFFRITHTLSFSVAHQPVFFFRSRLFRFSLSSALSLTSCPHQHEQDTFVTHTGTLLFHVLNVHCALYTVHFALHTQVILMDTTMKKRNLYKVSTTPPLAHTPTHTLPPACIYSTYAF